MWTNSSQILEQLMNIIGTKLRVSPSLLSSEDVGFAKNIVRCFNQILNWRKTYPELKAQLTDELFRSIFEDMSSHFSSTDDEDLALVCQFCEVEFPLLNHDLSFSYDMHKQEPEHMEIVNIFKEFHSLSPKKPTTNQPDDRGDLNCPATPAACRDNLDSTEGTAQSTKKRKKKKSKRTEVSVPPMPVNMSENELTGNVSNRDDVNCAAPPNAVSCDTRTILQSTKKRKKKKKSKQKKTSLSSLSNLANQSVAIAGIYTSNDESRLAYFLNKICILLRNPGYTCGFCGLAIAADTNCVKAHFESPSHTTALTQMIRSIDPKCALIEPSIFTALGCKVPECHLCGRCKLPENNPANYFAHVRTRCHLSKIEVYFKSPLFEDWERGIIFRNGSPYCAVCEAVLPSEVSMWEHLSQIEHRSKFQ